MYPLLLKKVNRLLSVGLLVLILAIVLGGSTITAIADRHRIAPIWGTHDIILQQEAAMRYVLQKKNPYKETYFGTPVEMFGYSENGVEAVNPALYHYVMPPGYLLGHFPFYVVANRTVGYFDGRMVSLVVMVGMCLLLWLMLKNRVLKELAIVLTALSPATVSYFIEGRSDFFALFWLLTALLFLQRKYFVIASVMMGMAFLSKQTMWFALPLFFVLLLAKLHPFLQEKNSRVSTVFTWIKTLLVNATVMKKIILYIFLCIVIITIVSLPFILWDAQSFFNSVVFYLSQGGSTGYPISGYGFSMVLYSLGIFSNLKQYYPFILWQLGLGIPVLIVFSWYLLRVPKLSVWFVSYGLFLFVIWYFSRYFNNSHIAFLSSIFILGIVFHYDEQLETKN